MPPLSNSLPDLMTLANQTSITSDDALELLGHCTLVCALLDPETPAALKKELATRILQSLKRSSRVPEPVTT